ncbi:uncharacterized protein J7T54_007124 [Emericellopsis cladophorae]|uniref:Uncharacterized protein n=1 Tax=Emericellopsis cladophorae TaxID=2686198 RepID=A0A9Q0BHT5_9HYPO|nr:uncharacterized protein J7T54_007124 [Emericellopsis cladophorae]KAI6785481.1 hypothetical protein J7T54_007124 [Emericellopsis cladophorae]
MPPFAPSPTAPDAPTLVQRQTEATVTVFADGPSGNGHYLTGGAIAGIVLGTIAGTLILLWLIKSCINFNKPLGEPVEKVRYEPPSHHHHHGHHRRSRSSRRRSSRRPSRASVEDDELKCPSAVHSISTSNNGKRVSPSVAAKSVDDDSSPAIPLLWKPLAVNGPLPNAESHPPQFPLRDANPQKPPDWLVDMDTKPHSARLQFPWPSMTCGSSPVRRLVFAFKYQHARISAGPRGDLLSSSFAPAVLRLHLDSDATSQSHQARMICKA